MKSRIVNAIIAKTMRRIRDDLISKRDRKSKLRKTSLQLKQKWMIATLDKKRMKRSELYTSSSWMESSRVLIAMSKKISIAQHDFDDFVLSQRVYFDDNDNDDNIIVVAIKVV